ncbi:MerR family DNA-binding transcriptional regulator [Streptomyces decoyicus]
MLSISEFSEMCHLPPQTLRYYHSEGSARPGQRR